MRKDCDNMIAAATGGHVVGKGVFKLVAVKGADGKIQWEHFRESLNGHRLDLFRGEAESMAQLELIISIMNKNLRVIFGEDAVMHRTTRR
jgi:hypothetical protein